MNQLVSIVIPCWNGENFVAEAIDSALAQTYPHVEVIVIDDGSTDRTVDVLRSFGDRIRWETTPNLGGCAARNLGIKLSRGEFVQFLDADDILYPEKLSRMVPLAQKAGADALALCDWEVASARASARRELAQIQYEGEDAFTFFLKGGALISSPLHWKKRLEDVGGFRADLPCCQEYDLHLRLAANNLKLICIPEPLWLQHRTSGSVSSSMHKVLLTFETIFLTWDRRLSEQYSESRSRAEALAEEFVKCARLLVRHGDTVSAQRYVAHARRIDPLARGLQAFKRRESRILAQTIGPVRAEAIIQRAAAVMRRLNLSAQAGDSADVFRR